MEAESFFARWSKRNAEVAEEKRQAEDVQPAPVEEAPPPPTMEDVAALTPESDFKPFVARGVDENVRRSAMKKLFADPHFNVMDGLDVYIEDYNKFEPIPPEMLAALNHAKALLDPLSQIEHPLMRLLESVTEAAAPQEMQEVQEAQEQPEPSAQQADAEAAPPPQSVDNDANPHPDNRSHDNQV